MILEVTWFHPQLKAVNNVGEVFAFTFVADCSFIIATLEAAYANKQAIRNKAGGLVVTDIQAHGPCVQGYVTGDEGLIQCAMLHSCCSAVVVLFRQA